MQAGFLMRLQGVKSLAHLCSSQRSVVNSTCLNGELSLLVRLTKGSKARQLRLTDAHRQAGCEGHEYPYQQALVKTHEICCELKKLAQTTA